MAYKKRSKRYYMLDRKDITNVRGIITSGEVMDELGLTNCGFERFVYQNKDYHGCYLVEVDEDEESSKFKEYKFFELNASRCPSRWYVTCDGRFYRLYIRSGKKHELMPYLHHGIWTLNVSTITTMQLIGRPVIHQSLTGKRYLEIGAAMKKRKQMIIRIGIAISVRNKQVMN